MELQDRSRLYPNLAPVQGNLVMGSDGRLQYAPISQMVPSAPSAPSAPPAPQAQSHLSYPVVSAPVLNSDAMDAQRSLDCWAKWVRIVSAVILTLNVVGHAVWAIKVFNTGPREHLPMPFIIGRVVLFFLICITCKLGLRAGKLKTSANARCFLKMLIFMGLLTLALFGLSAFKKSHKGWKGKNHHDDHRERNGDRNHDNNGEEGGEGEEGQEEGGEEENIPSPPRKLSDSEVEKNTVGHDHRSRDDNQGHGQGDCNKHHDKNEEGWNGENHHRDEESRHHDKDEYKDNKGNSDRDEDDDDDDRKNGDRDENDDRDEERGKGKHGHGHKGKRCAIIGGAIVLVIYSVMLFSAFKLYQAAKRFEQHAQRGNVPMVPVMAQQPVLAYAPGLYPGNIPMGAPVQH